MYAFHSRESCPACKSGHTKTVYSSKFSEGPISVFLRGYYKIDPVNLDAAPYELRLCSNCALVFQRYVGDAELILDLYTTWQLQNWGWEVKDPEVDFPAYGEHIREMRLSLFAHEIMVASSFIGIPLNQMKTLDYGMGWGLWVRIAAQLGCDSYGLELAEAQMEYVRRHGAKAITDDEIPAHKFHFVNTEQVFEHVPDPVGLLTRLSDSLAPGGVVKISVPSGERVGEIISSLSDGSYKGEYNTIMPLHPLEHVNSFKRRSIKAMAKTVGLKPVRPSLLQGYSFIRYPGTISISRPKKALKELIRPIYQWRNPSNIYMWLQKSA